MGSEANFLTIRQASPWLQGRTFASWRTVRSRGYLIFERVLSPDRVPKYAPRWRRILGVTSQAAAISGLRASRVYAFWQSPLFAGLRSIRWRGLRRSGTQIKLPAVSLTREPASRRNRPQPGISTTAASRCRGRATPGISAFWAIDDTTELNGNRKSSPKAICAGTDGPSRGGEATDFSNETAPDADRGFCNQPDASKADDAVGSLAAAKENSASRRRQPVGSAAFDHHAAMLRGLGAAAREYGARRSAELAEELPDAPAGSRLFDPPTVHGACVDGVHPGDYCARGPADGEKAGSGAKQDQRR
jgi:hypothetical protein